MSLLSTLSINIGFKFSYEIFTPNLLRSLHNIMINQQVVHWDDLESMNIIIDQVKNHKIETV